MGLRCLMIWIFGLFFASALFNPCLSENNVTLEKQPWPSSKNCELCVPVQFGRLEMRLPLANIGKILVHGSDDSALHILPENNDPLEGVVFLTVKSESLIERYHRLGFFRGQEITTNEQFFDALGRLPIGKTPFLLIRRIEHVDKANRYIKTSKSPLHVYWIQSRPPNSQYVYFVIDGEEIVYLLTGNVTQEFFEALLSNLRVEDVP